MNVVALVGNLASDVDVRDLGDEKQVATFLLAVNRPTRDEADFFRVTAWNKQAELCGRYLAKGRRVGVEGRLKSDEWQDNDGKKRRSTEVVANRVEFLSPPPDAKETPFAAAAASA
jgi:single-strand DNA-binding protein